MATRKLQKSRTQPRQKQRTQIVDEFAFPSEQERLPVHVPGSYQVTMGTGEETLAWLQGVPPNMQTILIPFPNEASYRKYAPIFRHLAHRLPEIVARVQSCKFEQLVDALRR